MSIVIHDVDESVRNLIRRDVLNGSDVEVLLDAPTSEWSARRNAPTLDVYLYDVREDMDRREHGLVDVYDDSGRVTARVRPPRYYKLSYLVSAWTQRPEDEHRLLSAVLSCFVRYDRLPDEVLVGQLEGTRYPLDVTIAVPPPHDRGPADVWSALGGELKPSLDLVVTTPLDLARAQAAGPPVLEPVALDVAAGDARERRRQRARAKQPDRLAAAPTVETAVGGEAARPGRTFHMHMAGQEEER